MKLSKQQKKIVKDIMNGKFTDILSYVKYNNLGWEVSFNKESVEEKFREAYSGKKYICDSRDFYEHNSADRVIEVIDKQQAYCIPRLVYIDARAKCYFKDFRYAYDLFRPIYITDCINEIISFIALWQYLKSQALIIELPKSCTEEDMALFLEQKKDDKQGEVWLEDSEDKKYSYYDLDISFNNFFNGDYKLNDENFERCLPYLESKIYPAPALKTYIDKGFNTSEELNNKKNTGIAFAGVVIAIVTSVLSLVIPNNEVDYTKELQKGNQYLQDINDSLVKFMEASREEFIEEKVENIEDGLGGMSEEIQE